MENNHRTALKSFGKGQGKDKHFQGQMQRVFTAFLRHPKTMLAGLYTTNPDLFPIVEPSKPKGNE